MLLLGQAVKTEGNTEFSTSNHYKYYCTSLLCYFEVQAFLSFYCSHVTKFPPNGSQYLCVRKLGV